MVHDRRTPRRETAKRRCALSIANMALRRAVTTRRHADHGKRGPKCGSTSATSSPSRATTILQAGTDPVRLALHVPWIPAGLAGRQTLPGGGIMRYARVLNYDGRVSTGSY